MNFIGNNITFLRKKNDLTQAEMCAQLDVRRSTLSNWENSQSEPGIEMIIRLSDYFGVELSDFIGKELSLSDDVHLSDKIKTLKKQQNVPKNVHPSVHQNTLKPLNEAILNEPETPYNHSGLLQQILEQKDRIIAQQAQIIETLNSALVAASTHKAPPDTDN